MKTPRNGRHETNGHPSLEERVALLEAEVARLKQAPSAIVADGWESIVGIDKGNPFFLEMVKAMKRHRDEEYSQARGKTGLKKRRRSSVATTK